VNLHLTPHSVEMENKSLAHPKTTLVVAAKREETRLSAAVERFHIPV
jgi:hypothetical protein